MMTPCLNIQYFPWFTTDRKGLGSMRVGKFDYLRSILTNIPIANNKSLHMMRNKKNAIKKRTIYESPKLMHKKRNGSQIRRKVTSATHSISQLFLSTCIEINGVLHGSTVRLRFFLYDSHTCTPCVNVGTVYLHFFILFPFK